MPYTMKDPPTWLENLPKGAMKIGIDVFNAVFERDKDEEKARRACWAAIKAKYEKGEDGNWHARASISDSESGRIIQFRAGQADATGLVWDCILIAPGLGLGAPRFYWTDEVLAAAVEAGIFNGVDVCAYELTADFFTHLPIPNVSMLEDVKRYLAAKKVGTVESTSFEPGVGIKGLIRFVAEQRWVPDTIAQGKASGNDTILGLSIDSRIKGFEVLVDEWTVIWVTQIISASSVDVVTRPAAGGKFLRAVAGLNEEGNQMKDKLLKLIQEKRPDLLKGKDAAALSDDEIMALARQAVEQPEKRAEQGLPALSKEEVAALIRTAVDEQEQRAACGLALESGLNASDLPDITRARIRTQFAGRIFKSEELDAAIKGEKEYLAQMASPHQSALPWGSQVRVAGGIGQRDKISMAVDLMFGLTKEDAAPHAAMRRLDGRPVFEGIRAAQDYDALTGIPLPAGLRELYVLLTGDTEINGMFNRANLPADLRAAQEISSATFTFLLGNTLARRMVKDYLAVNYKEDLLISIRKSAKDFRAQEAVMVGYFADIADVDPEAADYAEIAAVTDEEASYSVGQKGNILTITRKTIINDDMSIVQRLVSRLGRAARRTHAKYVWNMFISNTNCTDGTAWFTAPHGNLGALALSFAAAIAAYTALATMTEKDSGERIGLLDDPTVKPVLVYPVNILQTAESIINDEYYFTANDLTTKTRNPLKGKIGGAQLGLLTDVNDWGMLMPPEAVDMVEMSYLNGRQEPEFFLADSPQSEQVFVADKIRYKIRHEYAGHVIDFRSGFKAHGI